MSDKKIDSMTCVLLGHNLYKSSTEENSNIAICKSCGTSVDINQNGNFIESNRINRNFAKTFRHLFLLKRNLTSHL